LIVEITSVKKILHAMLFSIPEKTEEMTSQKIPKIER
jgi:hypothetical protein